MPRKNSENFVTGVTENDKNITEATVKKFKIEKLRENALELFGITVSTFDGAMYGQNETEMTIAEARDIINKWLGRKG